MKIKHPGIDDHSAFIVVKLQVLLRISLMILAIFANPSHAAAQTAPVQPLDDDYQKIISSAYHELDKNAAFSLSSTDLTTLISAMNTADKANNADKVIGLAVANMDIIQKNINAKEIANVSRLILKHHATDIAKNILNYAKKNGDRYAQARQNFELAKYYANQKQWDDAIAYLKTFDLTNDVSQQDSDEAYIIVGAALQAKKTHRQALEYYRKIKPDSPHYTIAQLDMALVYIRQDWWTDAQITMEDAIKTAPKDDIEMVNRLYTVMGFSQLQQGFYRNARETFRHVKINSAYSNRALLGIGMAALNQEDYAGAINAFQQLKKHAGNNDNDMSIAQSYLLEAFTLAKTKQNDSATEKYNEAVNYYQNKVNYYGNLVKTLKENTASPQSLLNVKLDDNIINEQVAIKTLAEKLNTLTQLQSYPISHTLQQQAVNVYARLYKTYLDASLEAINKKQTVFNNYLNQSNFGLTRLYDNQ